MVLSNVSSVFISWQRHATLFAILLFSLPAFSRKIKENKMQDASSHNHLAPRLKGFFHSLPPSLASVSLLLLARSLSFSLPLPSSFLMMILLCLAGDSSRTHSLTLRLFENRLIPILFHTSKIKHSWKTRLQGESDWLNLWQVFHLCWHERQRKIRCSTKGLSKNARKGSP